MIAQAQMSPILKSFWTSLCDSKWSCQFFLLTCWGSCHMIVDSTALFLILQSWPCFYWICSQISQILHIFLNISHIAQVPKYLWHKKCLALQLETQELKNRRIEESVHQYNPGHRPLFPMEMEFSIWLRQCHNNDHYHMIMIT